MSVINVLSVARHFSRNNQILKQIHCCSVYLHYSSKQSCLGYSREESVQLQQKKLIPAHTNQVLSYTSRRWFSSPPKSTSDGDLIYTGNLGKAVLGVKFFSYSSSMFSLCLMPYILTKTGLGVSSLALKVAFCGFIGFFTFLTPVLLHLVTKGYVVRLYHDRHTDVYTAVTYNALLVEKKTVFHQSDVAVPDVSRMFTSFYAKKRSMLVNPELFQIPHDYNHLMGYDRPFSFDLDEINKPDRR